MRYLGKLENVKLCKVEVDTEVMVRSWYSEGWSVEGQATYKIGLKKQKVTFLVPESEKPQKIFYLERYGCNPPKDKLQNEALLTLIYGQVMKNKAMFDLIEFFREKRQQEEEEKRKKEEEEKKKQIALGEQISFEKYLLNL